MEMSVADWALSIDEKTCIHSGLCIAAAPATFRAGISGSQVVSAEVVADEVVAEAAEGCPVEAIRVRDLNTGAVVAPEGIEE